MWNRIIEFFSQHGIKVLIVLGIIVLGYLLIRLISRILKRVMARRNIDDIVSYFFVTLIKVILIILLIVAAFDIMGISTAPFVAVLGTIGLALALSMQESLSNIASGIVIIVTKPFKKGDYVEVGGIAGSVQKINMLTTELITPDNKEIILPNNKVAKTEIINYSYQKIRRVDFKFNVAYGSEINKVKAVIGKVIESHSLILSEPAPQIRLMEHASSSLLFITRMWVKTPDYWTVYFDIQEKVYEALTENNIIIPYNKLDVNLIDKRD